MDKQTFEQLAVKRALRVMKHRPCACGKQKKAEHVEPCTEPKVEHMEGFAGKLLCVGFKGKCNLCKEVHRFCMTQSVEEVELEQRFSARGAK